MMDIDKIETARLDDDGSLVLTDNTTVEGDLEIDGRIYGENGSRFNLKVKGDIDAWDIDAWDIDAWDIDARNIDARNIDAINIDAWDIDASGELSYYAFCNVYKSIEAGNIEARRINGADPVALDGEVNETGQNICEKCGRPMERETT